MHSEDPLAAPVFLRVYLTSKPQPHKKQVLKNWLCSAVSAKLRACIPKFFSLSYRVFNLGICIPTLELDSRFLERYGACHCGAYLEHQSQHSQKLLGAPATAVLTKRSRLTLPCSIDRFFP